MINREYIAKQVYLLVCPIPDELDYEWNICGENMQQNCLYIADRIIASLKIKEHHE